MNIMRLVAPLLVVAILVSGLVVLDYTVPADIKRDEHRGLTTRYYRDYFEPAIRIRVPGTSSRAITISRVYFWALNGSLIDLGRYRSVGGVIKIPKGKIVEVYGEVAEYVKREGLDPDSVGLGLVILNSIHMEDGVYTNIIMPPLRIGLASKPEVSIEVTSSQKSIKIRGIEDVRKDVASSLGVEPEKVVVELASETAFTRFINLLNTGRVEEYCYYTGGPNYGRVICYEWRLDKTYGSFSNVDIPLAMGIIRWLDRVREPEFNVVLMASEQFAISVGIAPTFGIGSNYGGASYEVPGLSWAAYSQRSANLNLGKRFIYGADYNSPSILYVGFKGNATIGLFKEYLCVYPDLGTPTCSYLGVDANATIARPFKLNLDNSIGVIGAAPLPNTEHYLVKTYQILKDNNWFGSWKYITGPVDLRINSTIISAELNTIPLLSGSISVGAVLFALVGGPIPAWATALLCVSIGITASRMDQRFMFIGVSFVVNSGKLVAYRYINSPYFYKYQDGSYKIGGVYVETW
ncbi:hypothetical protein Desmu_1051 [Desulfurococcus mucosus DSM 2162]|uniref:Uncharacterized protein n=1 Tax=Desulfurococcus mucosus (strain ATCC 35584 / DSM 2162 / JCM 9187 / O7/1) TaxID=765177 RepID=E8RA27_DESM0|nr:hypothetical protein Desmu_1051 [Desulfurococcus mucosus DSM 2162]